MKNVKKNQLLTHHKLKSTNKRNNFRLFTWHFVYVDKSTHIILVYSTSKSILHIEIFSLSQTKWFCTQFISIHIRMKSICNRFFLSSRFCSQWNEPLFSGFKSRRIVLSSWLNLFWPSLAKTKTLQFIQTFLFSTSWKSPVFSVWKLNCNHVEWKHDLVYFGIDLKMEFSRWMHVTQWRDWHE